MTGTVRFETGSDVAIVTLDRPDKANAAGPAERAALREAIASAENDPDIRALVLTGTGDRVFCSGADLDEKPGAMTVDAARRFNADWAATTGALASSRLMTVARLNGTAAGGGVALAIACDLRVAAPAARIFYPALARGVLPPPEDAGRLASLIGPARAKALLLAGRRIEAEEALDWGLLDAIAAPGALDETIDELTEDARAADAGHLRALKAAIGGALHDPEILAQAYQAVYGRNSVT